MGPASTGGKTPAPNTTPVSNQAIQLEFIDVQDPHSKSRARSHVVRGWRRQNRLKDIKSHQQSGNTAQIKAQDENDDDDDDSIPTIKSPTLQSLAKKRQGSRLNDESKRYSHRRGSDASSSRRSPSGSFIKSEHDKPSPSSLILTEPMTKLSVARTDPFNSLPIDLSQMQQEVVNHFVGRQAILSFDLSPTARWNPNQDLVFHSSKENLGALHGLLAMGAIHLATRRRQPESTMAMHHLGESMRLLRDEMKDIGKNMSTIILNICGLIIFNEFREAYDQSEIHVRGVMQLLQNHGGLVALEGHPRIQRLAAYVTTAGYSSSLRNINMHRLDVRNSTNRIEPDEKCYFQGFDTSPAVAEVYMYLQDFLGLLSNIEAARLSFTSTTSLIRPLQNTLFHPQGLFFKVLSDSKMDHSRKAGVGNNRIHRASCLILIALNLLELGDQPFESEVYLKDIQEIYVQNELDIRPNLRLFHHRLIQGKNELCLADAHKSWQMMRFMQVFRVLSWSTGHWILDCIYQFLAMTGMNKPSGISTQLADIVNDVLISLSSSDQRAKLGCIPTPTEYLYEEESEI